MRRVVAVVTVFLLFSGAFGQRRPRPGTVTSTPTYSTTQVDPNSKQLPPYYKGVDPAIVYEELGRRSKENVKGEFETTETFKGRIAKQDAMPLIGNIRKDAPIPLSISNGISILDKVTSLYDADKNELTASLELESPIIGVEANLEKRSIGLKIVFGPTSTYIGQNAFGAKVAIEKTHIDTFAILVENFRDFLESSPETYGDKLSVTVSMSPSEAMAAKANLRVLALVTLTDPYFERGFISHKPTVSEPRDTLATLYYLVGDVTQFWFYNYATGQVYAKLQPRQSRSS